MDTDTYTVCTAIIDATGDLFFEDCRVYTVYPAF